jgi:dihydrofolate reductase
MFIYKFEVDGEEKTLVLKSFDQLPTGVLRKNRNNDAEGMWAMLEWALTEKDLEKYNSEDIYIIGGQKIYEQLVDECDVAHITKVDFEYDADAYFPNLDEKPEWQITGDSEEQTYFDLEFYFLRYEKVK